MLIFLLITILANVTVLFTTINPEIYRLLQATVLLCTYTWVYLLYQASTFKRHWTTRIIFMLFALVIISVLFKIQHWPQAGTMLILSFGGLILVYIVRFGLKPSRSLIDWIKLLWISTTLFLRLLILQHILPKDYLIISNILLLLLSVAFVFAKIHEKNETMI